LSSPDYSEENSQKKIIPKKILSCIPKRNPDDSFKRCCDIQATSTHTQVLQIYICIGI
jgi:hypothetical protein